MDLKGKFYRIMNMRQFDEQKLDDILFREQVKEYSYSSYQNKKESPKVIDSKYIAETDFMSDWPYGRAIYVNEDKSFIINVGNIDHLEIRAYQDHKSHDTCDIETAFKTLMRGTAHLDQHLEFAYDENIGYTTSIVSNLGVLDFKIKFEPKYFKFYRFRLTPEVISKRFSIECIEDMDEDGIVQSQTLILKNKIKFGMTESQIVQNLIDCL